jgi:hypothetical protein
MSKKVMLLALAVVSAVAFALPPVAMAEDEPLHIEPTPTAASNALGGTMKLSTIGGTTLTCEKVTGVIHWETGTTGKIDLTFENNCISNLFGVSCSSVTTTELPFHLLTLPSQKPGVLITPGANGHVATFTCGGGLVKAVINAGGLVGTITSPFCGGESTTMAWQFRASADGVQEHKTVAGTTTEYDLQASINGGAFETAALDFDLTITFSEGKKKLNCT